MKRKLGDKIEQIKGAACKHIPLLHNRQLEEEVRELDLKDVI